MVCFLLSFDIFCLSETFVASEREYSSFTDYDVFMSKSTKLSFQGRESGGVLVFVKKHLSTFVKHIKVRYENMVVLELSRNLLGLEKNVFLIGTYVPPYDSKFWNVTDNGYGLELLEQCLVDLYEEYDDFHLIIGGDLNARTGNDNMCTDKDMFDGNIIGDSVNSDEAVQAYERVSDDCETNMFGKQLLEICQMFDCVILNGLCRRKFDRSCTYISHAGCSTIDYFLVSSDICAEDIVHSFDVLPCVDSNHLPVSIIVSASKTSEDADGANESNKQGNEWKNKIFWNQEKQNDFQTNLSSDCLQDVYSRAMDLIEYDTNHALELFTNLLLDASECMVKRVPSKRKQIHDSIWFDDDCKQAKNNAKFLQSIHRKTKTNEDRLAYVAARKAYKSLIRKKKAGYKREKARRLGSFAKDSRSFWRELKTVSGKKKNTPSENITENEWFDHFRNVFNQCTPTESGPHHENIIHEGAGTAADLDRPISAQEVTNAIHKLKNGKAPGTDGIFPEMIKNAGDLAVKFLTKLFNRLFDEGIYPEEWCKAIVVPIFKKGDKNITDNYRGVSLLSLISKCYTSVLNSRLVTWAEENNKLTEAQAGFRRGYSTSDHIFTLNAIVEKCLSKRGGKLYACFVDLKKAFDSVHRESLINVLHSNGLSGKFIRALEAMYRSVLSCVRVKDKLTELFDCPGGLRQGCILSPVLFSLYINEMASHIEQHGCHGIQLLPGLVDIFLLLFADDIVLMSDSPRGLQTQLNLLNSACKTLSLKINTDKTKVMVFRKGGFLGKYEKWNLDGNDLEVVNEYNYLGFTFTTKMSVTKGVDVLASKGKCACIECIRYLGKLSELSKDCFFKIFDTQVQPVLLYASEVWGLHRLSNVEKVHTLACKRYLNVPLKVPNKFVYGETGRYPLYINSAVRCVRYWLKILRMDPSRLPKQAYLMLFHMDERGKKCWASNIRNILFSLGFGYVWLQQEVGCDKTFLSVFKQRLMDIYVQEWNASVMHKDMYERYRSFKTIFGSEMYFKFVDIKCFRDSLVKLRLGILPLNGSGLKSTFGNVSAATCCFCNEVETEEHFVCYCPLYNDIRKKYLSWLGNGRLLYLNILKCDSVNNTRNLGAYVFHAMCTRTNYIENVIQH